MQESWLKEDDQAKLSEIEDLGYKIISAPRKNRGGGGLAVLYKGLLNVKIHKTSKRFKSLESMEVIVKGENELIRFINLYRPPYSRKHKFTVKDFTCELEQYLNLFLLNQGCQF